MGMAIRSIRRLLARGAICGIVAMLLSGVGAAALAADHGVDIAGFAFSPDTITVKVGDSITWTNGDAVSHTATADDASFDTGTIAAGSSKSATFTTVGTFAYHCKIHTTMTATVVVSAAGSGTPPATDTVGRAASTQDSTPFVVVALAALCGLLIAHRRFDRAARSTTASIDD
jgi:plastocyanin